jgi:hypothetical protein
MISSIVLRTCISCTRKKFLRECINFNRLMKEKALL